MAELKLNIQQQPKSAGYLECWVPRPNHKLLQIDFASVEPTVLAEFSKCPSYRKLYGPEAAGNDVYLFVGAQFPIFRDKFLAHYDPDNPTPEAIATLKKLYKNDRAICKEAHLAMQYGAGPNTVHAALTRKEIDVPFQEVVDMHAAYWSPDLFAVVKEYEARKLRQWRKQGGWITNCLGRPLAVAHDKTKDILNRDIQSTAHDLLQKLLRLIDAARTKQRLPMWPWILDLHDESIWEIEDSAAEEGVALFVSCLKQLNEELGWEIQIKGEPQLANNLAAIKVEGYTG